MMEKIFYKLNTIPYLTLLMFVACSGHSAPRDGTENPSIDIVEYDSSANNKIPKDSCLLNDSVGQTDNEAMPESKEPACIKQLIGDADWEKMTICTANGIKSKLFGCLMPHFNLVVC